VNQAERPIPAAPDVIVREHDYLTSGHREPGVPRVGLSGSGLENVPRVYIAVTGLLLRNLAGVVSRGVVNHNQLGISTCDLARFDD